MDNHEHKWITTFTTFTQRHQYCKICGEERMIDNPTPPANPTLFYIPDRELPDREEPDSTVNSTT